MKQSQHWPKDFCASDFISGVEIIQDGRFDEIPFFKPRDFCAPAIEHGSGSLLNPFPNDRLDSRFAFWRNDRSHLHLLIQAITDNTAGGGVDETLGERSASIADRYDQGRGEASLAGATEGALDRNARGHLKIGIGEDN